MATDLTEVIVAPDTFHVSPEPMLMIADLHGALALCLHDEGRAVGGLLHLRFMGGTGRPSDVTDNTLSSVLVVLDRFKRAVLGNAARGDEVQARILAHALPPTDAGEPSASLVDLIQADLADGKIASANLHDADSKVTGRLTAANGGPGDRYQVTYPERYAPQLTQQLIDHKVPQVSATHTKGSIWVSLLLNFLPIVLSDILNAHHWHEISMSP